MSIQENTMGQLMATRRTVWGPTVPTLKGTEMSLSYVQCFLYLVSSSTNASIFRIAWLGTFWTALVQEITDKDCINPIGHCQTVLNSGHQRKSPRTGVHCSYYVLTESQNTQEKGASSAFTSFINYLGQTWQNVSPVKSVWRVCRCQSEKSELFCILEIFQN